MCFESIQLRMIGVSPGFSTEHSLGKQRLAPKSDKTLRVEVFRVK